jgi:hypothetical protein
MDSRTGLFEKSFSFSDFPRIFPEKEVSVGGQPELLKELRT